MPNVPTCPSCLVRYVLLSPTCLVPYVLLRLTCLMSKMLSYVTCFVSYSTCSLTSCAFVLCVSRALVPNVSHGLRSLRTSRALVPYMALLPCTFLVSCPSSAFVLLCFHASLGFFCIFPTREFFWGKFSTSKITVLCK